MLKWSHQVNDSTAVTVIAKATTDTNFKDNRHDNQAVAS